jgi:hypothetical protein
MDWRKNRIAIGATVFVALLALTLWAINRRDAQPSRAQEIPSIELDEATITALEINRANDERVVLSKVDETWRVTEPLDADADQNNVKSALNRLSDLRITRVVATQPEHYARLQVDDENAVQVKVKGGETTLIELRVGKYGDGVTMVRIEDRPEVFGVGGSLRYAFDRELKAWRDRKVVQLETADVQSVRFDGPKGAFAFQRQDQGWIATEGETQLGEFDPKQVDGRLSTAARLTATGFAPEETSAARAGLTEPKATVTMTTSGDEAETVVLELGDATDEGDEFYLWRKDNATIYVISTYLAERLQPDAAAFEKPKAPPAPPPGAPGLPPGAQQQPQLPPEVMKQLQEQIRQQQEAQQAR